MTQVNKIGGMSNGCVHSEVLGDLHPDNVIENISEANDGSRQGEQGDLASDEVTDVDRGWAWVVLGATFLVKALTMAFPLCVGVFYTDLQNVLNASNREVSWVPAIMRSLRHAAGPICSLLVKKFGCRATVMFGGVLSGLGLAASFLIHSIKWLYVTAIITGIGFCFSSQPSVNIIQHYFKARLVFANALSSTGMAVGICTLPLLANYLHTELCWRGSFVVLGGLLLNNCVCGAVMRPPRDPVGRGMPLINLPPSLPEEECSTTERLTRLQVWRDVKAFVSEHLAIDQLFQNSRYCAYACGVTWMTLGYGVPMIYLVPYATAGGMEQSKAALVLTCLGGVNAVTRPLFALIFHMPWFKGRYIYAFSWALLINGLSNCICCAGPDFPVLMAYAVIQGVSMSAVGSLMFTILMDLVEMRCFSSALGLFNLMQSVTLLLGPPLAGFLIDWTGQFLHVFVAFGFLISSAAVLLLVVFYWLDTRPSVDLAPASRGFSARDKDDASSRGVEIIASIQNPLAHIALRPRRRFKSGRLRPYTLSLGRVIKQKLWQRLDRPLFTDTVNRDGLVHVDVSYGVGVFPPLHQVDILGEPRPGTPSKS